MSPLFTPLHLPSPQGGLTLSNRIVIAPMCQYSASEGRAGDWHLFHWANLLNSGAGMCTLEATAITPEGRITPQCLGLWDDATASALSDVLGRARRLAPAMPVCIQLAHAGRKASSAQPWRGGQLLSAADGGWTPLAPSPLPQLPGEAPPQALDSAGLARIRQAFVAAAQRAAAIGIEAIELHAAHGYLLHQFLSPLSNQRGDGYGGGFDARIRFVLEVFEAVRAAFNGVLGVRLSATDWVEGGWSAEETVALAQKLKDAGVNFLHLSSAGISPQQKIPVGPGYQVDFACQVKSATGVPTFAVGLITDALQAQEIVASGQADAVAIARALLYNPRWPWAAAAQLGAQLDANPTYWRSLPREAGSVFVNARIGMR
jgi:2,4-dienoyl-CoA reductase-like NADH-dependent reductase (Old Yellow Enzyme family)